VTIVSKVKQECIRIEFRRAPHRGFGAHDLFDVVDERRTFAAVAPHRMNDDVISFAVDVESVVSPIGRNFSWGVDHNVPIRELKICLIFLLCAAIDDAPAIRRFDREADRILLMIDDVHKHAAAVEVRVTRIEL